MQGEAAKVSLSDQLFNPSTSEQKKNAPEPELSHFDGGKDTASPGLIWIDLKKSECVKTVRRDLGGTDIGFTGLGYDPKSPKRIEPETKEFRVQISQLGPGTSNRAARFFLLTQRKLRELALSLKFGQYHLNESLDVRSDPDVLGILDQLFFTPGYLAPPSNCRWSESELERIAKICMWLATVPAIQVPITNGRQGIDVTVNLSEPCPTPSGWLWGVLVLGPSLERHEHGPE
jgi:hypothetical protein